MDRDAVVEADKQPLTGPVPDVDGTRSFRSSGPKCEDKGGLEKGDMVDGNEIRPTFGDILPADNFNLTQQAKYQPKNWTHDTSGNPIANGDGIPAHLPKHRSFA